MPTMQLPHTPMTTRLNPEALPLEAVRGLSELLKEIQPLIKP